MKGFVKILAAMSALALSPVSIAGTDLIDIKCMGLDADGSKCPRPQAKIVGASTIFPSSMQVISSDANSTTVSLTFDLAGCVDILSDVHYYSQVDGDGVKLFVAATQLHNVHSRVVKCFAPPTAERTIVLPSYYTANQIQLARLRVVAKPVAVHPGSEITCMAYFTGFVYSPRTNSCIERGQSGCSNPFEFTKLESCQAAYGLN